MYRILVKAALSIAPTPLPADEAARLKQLDEKAFAVVTTISMLMTTLYQAHLQHKSAAHAWDTPTWKLWERLFRISQKASNRFRRRRAARETFDAQLPANPPLTHPLIEAADASAESYAHW